ncbi:hypothetical protein [Kribbella sp. CA-293567]|uniref:hypothetical protein n=1 Tax=Kribbella sp. CA-293567 TaxID=3002436 RepID=UPI0022DD19BD|nr:hypothetical protein [Kribbella sp. CA-293567]WBQ02270.1 hypothetical protein OX958_20005 [Kribbella sp. CA-293567]
MTGTTGAEPDRHDEPNSGPPESGPLFNPDLPASLDSKRGSTPDESPDDISPQTEED